MSFAETSPVRPRITLKVAQTLDGRVASSSGDSKWITGLEARQTAHRLRSQHQAVLVGVGTILADDPLLTVRHVSGRNPVRVVLDSTLRMSLNAAVLRVSDAPTIVVTTALSDARKRADVESLGVGVLLVPSEASQISLPAALAALSNENIGSVLVEGGPTVATALLRARMVDRIVAFIAPMILGRGIDAVGDLFTPTVHAAINIEDAVWSPAGRDIILEGTPVWPDGGESE